MPTADPSNPCGHEPRTLDPSSTADGVGRPCGVCGLVLYPRQHLVECPKLGCPDPLLGVVVETQWVGDAWVVDRATVELREPFAQAHVDEHHADCS